MSVSIILSLGTTAMMSKSISVSQCFYKHPPCCSLPCVFPVTLLSTYFLFQEWECKAGMGLATGLIIQVPEAPVRPSTTRHQTQGILQGVDPEHTQVIRDRGPGVPVDTPWDPHTMAVDSRLRCTTGVGATMDLGTPILQPVERPRPAGLLPLVATRPAKDILLITHTL